MPDQVQTDDIGALMLAIGARARTASRALAIASCETKNTALEAMADAILAAEDDILSANSKDVARAKENGITGSFIDRLELNRDRIAAMADGIRAIAALKDPVGDVIAAWQKPASGWRQPC